MTYILGLDPSLKKAGYVVLDIDKSDNIVEDRGLLKTSTFDGILVQRLIKQAAQIEDKIKEYKISFIGMEAPYFEGRSSEMLYALNQFLHKMFLDNDLYIVGFPPQMLKKLVFPEHSVTEIHKPHMIDLAKTQLNLQGRVLAEDVADAYWAGIFGKKFYNWHIRKIIKDEDLNSYELNTFKGSHTFVKGDRKGETEYNGIIYRENELFFDFKEIKRRAQNATKGDKEDKRARRNTGIK